MEDAKEKSMHACAQDKETLETFKGKTLDKYQSAVVREVLHGKGNLVVEAVAGSGKSFTLEAALSQVPKNLKTLVCAFAKRDQIALENRVFPQLQHLPKAKQYQAKKALPVQIATTHSMGLEVLKRQFPKVKVDTYKGKSHVEKVLNDNSMEKGFSELMKAMALGKAFLVENPEDLAEVVKTFNVDTEAFSAEKIASLAFQAIQSSKEDTARVDFDDMVWFPWAHDIRVSNMDLVLCDETQDLNKAQLWLVRSRVKPGGRIVAVGDRKQGIYRFRGADSEAMPRMIDELQAKTLPLSVSYRCPKSILPVVNAIVENFELPDWATEGTYHPETPSEDFFEEAKPGDLVLSRTNAPLVKTCLKFIREEIPAIVAGRDVAEGLLRLIKKSGKTSTVDFLEWLDAHKEAEIARLSKMKRESAIETLMDTVEILETLSEGTTDVSQIRESMDRIFADTENPEEQGKRGRKKTYKAYDPSKVVTLSTVHRQKGGEARNVWVFDETFRPGKTEAQNEENENIRYVAITRTQENLYMVQGIK